MVKRITILGGGTAGWLTAGILAARYHRTTECKIQVTLVESPDVSTIGVGEGTWPTMRTTLRKIGLSETDFISQCDASFKQGSKFIGWRDGASEGAYYHPFTAPSSSITSGFISTWRAHYPHLSFADAVTAQGRICDLGLAPKLITVPEYAGAANYAYHLDAGKFGNFLKMHCVEKLGVTHISDHVVHVNSHENGDIASLATRSNGDIAGDLFIDCSGSQSLLLSGHFQIPFIDQKRYSCNDSAIAMQVPYTSDSDPIASATYSTAQSAGWIWDIGLASRRGVGYVYSSAHADQETAERTIRSYAAKTVGREKAEQLTSKKLSFEAGHREQFWHRNCVAIGMAAGFIEPLEASALALVELSANMIRDELPMSRETMDIVSRRFNKLFHYRWARIIEFLKLHYVLSQRDDSDYWVDARRQENIPHSLQESLELWRYRMPYYNDFPQIEEIFPDASYQYVLYGMGFKPDLSLCEMKENKADLMSIQEVLAKAESFAANLPSNRELIRAIGQYGMQKV